MDKKVLKKISKEWCKGILLACDQSSFFELEDNGKLTSEEVQYIVNETYKIAERITDEPYSANLESIIDKYYEFDED